MSGDDNERDERVWEDGPWAPEWSNVNRRDFLLTLGVASTGAAGCMDRNDETDEDLMNKIGELFDEIDVLLTGSPDLLVAEYRSEALQALYNDVQAHDFNRSSKETLLGYLDSALDDNQQVMEAVLGLNPERASKNSYSVENNVSRVHQLVDGMESETTESWREQSETILNASEEPLSVFELIKEEQAAEEWWETIDERGDRIIELFQELEDRGYSPTVDEIDGKFGISVNFSYIESVGIYTVLKGAAYVIASAFGSLAAAPVAIGAVKVLGLAAGLYLAGTALHSVLLRLQQHHPVLQRLYSGAHLSDRDLLEFFADFLDIIHLIHQYDPDVHTPMQLAGTILLSLMSPIPRPDIRLPTPEEVEEEDDGNPDDEDEADPEDEDVDEEDPEDADDEPEPNDEEDEDNSDLSSSITVRLIDSETGEPISDGTVTLMYFERADDPFGPKSTDDEGVATYAGIDADHPRRAGEYGVRGRAAGYAEQDRRFTLEENRSVEITLELEPEDEVERSVLTVTVVDADTGNPVQTLPNVYVAHDGERVETARANDQGRAQISLQDGREYAVSAMDEIPRSSEERTVTVDGDTEITLALDDEDGSDESEPHVLTVNVLTAEGDPLHAYVRIEEVDMNEAVIDYDGEFAPTWTFELENGTYTVEVIDPGDVHLPAERTVEIDGGDEEITVQLEPNEEFPIEDEENVPRDEDEETNPGEDTENGPEDEDESSGDTKTV